jgi:hypothetical protein
VPAGSEKLQKKNISNIGHFESKFITGSFQTVYQSEINGLQIQDLDICYLTGQLIDGSNQRPLFDDFIPLNLFLSPGRVRSANSATLLTTDPPSGNLFYPIEFIYLWTINADILFKVKNASNVDLTYWMMFHGIRILTPKARNVV